MQGVIDLLKKWAELEPSRVEILTVSTARWPEDIGQFYIQVQPDDRRVLRIDEPFGFSTVATLCAVIEAAIIEKGWRYLIVYVLAENPFRVMVCTEFNSIETKTPIKLEALLSAYVQALEASK